MRQYQVELMKLAIKQSEYIDYCAEGIKLFPETQTYRVKRDEAIAAYSETLKQLTETMADAMPGSGFANYETITSSKRVA